MTHVAFSLLCTFHGPEPSLEPVDGADSLSQYWAQLTPSRWLPVNCCLMQEEWALSTHHQLVQSFMSAASLHYHISLWSLLGLPVVTVSAGLNCYSHALSSVSRRRHPLTVSFFLVETSLFMLSIGFNSHFWSFLGPGDPLPSFLYSSCCYIPATEWWLWVSFSVACCSTILVLCKTT